MTVVKLFASEPQNIQQPVSKELTYRLKKAYSDRSFAEINALLNAEIGVDSILFYYGETPLVLAIKSNDSQIIDIVMSKKPDTSFRYVWTYLNEDTIPTLIIIDPLDAVIRYKNWDMLKICDEPLNQFDAYRERSIIEQAFCSDKHEIVDYFLNKGLRVSAASRTYLSHRLIHDSYLLDTYYRYGGDMKELSDLGYSLFSALPEMLYMSQYSDDDYILKEDLIFHTSDTRFLNIGNINGGTPLHIMCTFRANIVGIIPLIDRMLENGALINIQDNYLRTPLMAAVMVGNVTIVEHLLKKGANPYLADIYKNIAFAHTNPPRQMRLSENREKIIKLLKKYQEKNILIQGPHFFDILYNQLTNTLYPNCKNKGFYFK